MSLGPLPASVRARLTTPTSSLIATFRLPSQSPRHVTAGAPMAKVTLLFYFFHGQNVAFWIWFCSIRGTESHARMAS